MSLKIGFLAIGEGGSNIGEYAAQSGFDVIAINTAKLDLDNLKVIPKENRIHLDGYEGAGRNRDIGKEAVINNVDKVFEKINKKFENCQIVFVVGSTAGGTGSGGLPIGIEILSELKNNVHAITILPDSNESPKAKMNSLECFSELSQHKQLNSTFIIDNDKANAIYQGKDRSQIYQLSNRQIIDNFAEICGLTRETSLVSNFDMNDLFELINERGHTIISKVTVPVSEMRESIDIVNVIRNSWKEVCSPDIGFGQIVKAGVFGKIPAELTSKIDTQKIFEETGMPYDIMEAYYPNTEHQNHCIFYTVLSGLAFPNERLNKMELEIQEIEQQLIERVETSRTQSFKTSNWGSKFKKEKPVQEKQMSLQERLARFK